MTVQSGPSLPLAVFNPMVPKEGPKIIPVQVDATNSTSVLVDLSTVQQQGRITFIQTIFVDNTDNTAFVDIVSFGLNARYRVPAGAQAILPFFVQNPPKFYVNTTGALLLPIFVLNVPLNPVVWNEDATGAATIVSDPALEALITNLGDGNGLGVYDLALFGLIQDKGYGSALDVNVVNGTNTPVSIFGGSAKLTAGVNTIDSAQSGAGKTWYITSIDITVSADTFFTGGGEFNIGVSEPGQADIYSTVIWLPGAAAPVQVGDNFHMTTIEFSTPFACAIPNDKVRAFVFGPAFAAITGGTISVNVYGFAK